MRLIEYILECRRLTDLCREKCQAVDEFLATQPDLSDELIFKTFWSLDTEAAKAHREYIAFSESNRGNVTP